MPFVKLDCGILNSTLWFEKAARDMFITALLMAEPREFLEPVPTIQIRSLQPAEFVAPPGWYGFVPAAGVGIMHRAKVDDDESGYAALELLASPEPSSRSKEFDGRRMVRIDGGYLILNYMKYRERDYTAAERAKRYRERLGQKAAASHRDVTPSHRNVTQAEGRKQKAENRSEKAEDAAATTPKPRHAPGPLAGSLPRDHIEHVWCGARFCLTTKMRDRLVRGYGGDPRAAEDAISAWVQAFHDGMGDSAYGGPQWLLQHFDAHLVAIGRVKPAPKAHAKPLTFRERLEAGKR